MAVSLGVAHEFSKSDQAVIRLIVGEGVAGDAHRGRTVQHRSRVAKDPTQPNLRQVHLIHAELIDELRAAGFGVMQCTYLSVLFQNVSVFHRHGRA